MVTAIRNALSHLCCCCTESQEEEDIESYHTVQEKDIQGADIADMLVSSDDEAH